MNPLGSFDPDDPYPESDGQPMAENTEQFDWIVKIKENLEILFADRRVSGPVEPDAMVVFGRPKGRRGCYKLMGRGRGGTAGRLRDPVARRQPQGDGR